MYTKTYLSNYGSYQRLDEDRLAQHTIAGRYFVNARVVSIDFAAVAPVVAMLLQLNGDDQFFGVAVAQKLGAQWQHQIEFVQMNQRDYTYELPLPVLSLFIETIQCTRHTS